MSSCTDSTFVAKQKFTPMFVDAYVVEPSSTVTLKKEVFVGKNEQVQVNTTINSTTTLQSTTPLNLYFEITRENVDGCNKVSLTNGPQTLDTLFVSSETNFAFGLVDTDVKKGKYKYSLHMINTNSTNVIDIDFVSFIVTSSKDLEFFVNQNFPALGEPPAYSLPKCSEPLVLPLSATVYQCGQVLLNFFTGITFDINDDNLPVYYDIQRDGESIINGKQALLNLNFSFAIKDEATLSVNVVDKDAKEGNHNYTIIFYNDGSGTFDIDYYSFYAVAVKNKHTLKFYVNQQFPPLNAPPALPLVNFVREEIEIDAHVHTKDQALIFFMIDINDTTPGLVSFNNIIFDVQRDGKSIINNIQNLVKIKPSVSSPSKGVFNLSFIMLDNDVCEGKHKYTIVLVDNSAATISEVDYYCAYVLS